MEFVTDLALSYIAFSAGRYFRIADLKRSGGKVLAVTLAEALCAAVAVTLTMIFVFRLSVPFALLLGAIGCATAPASTIMTIRQYRRQRTFRQPAFAGDRFGRRGGPDRLQRLVPPW